MNKIRIIDLLNKIANGEEIPHFKINEDEYYLGADGLLKDVYGDAVEWFIYQKWLNEEVEIIEEEIEEKEIEKIKKLKITDRKGETVIEGYLDQNRIDEIFGEKLNELIDAVNELKRGN